MLRRLPDRSVVRGIVANWLSIRDGAVLQQNTAASPRHSLQLYDSGPGIAILQNSLRVAAILGLSFVVILAALWSTRE